MESVSEHTILDATNSRPPVTKLEQNFPTPFNPETVIPFVLAESGRVHLAVYNILGQEVLTLIDDHYAVGRHSVIWSGRNAISRPASREHYFVKMIEGDKKSYIVQVVVH